MGKNCPFCYTEIKISLVRHIKAKHGEERLKRAILADKANGLPDAQIGDKYGVSFSYLERIVTQEYGANLSSLTPKKSRLAQWEPRNFQLETTTVWSFKNRGKWATHDGRYRGNWSPYIPRNLILRYSQPGEVVLDYFSGGGTTAVEAKLVGRRCIARDINADALALTKANLDFQPPAHLLANTEHFEPELGLGDARNLVGIPNNSIDLICAHPPYAGIISYSADAIEGDLSALPLAEFIAAMYQVAVESYRVLKEGRHCAILIGDSRKAKHIVPIGFLTIRAFLNAGFVLDELIIKRQHNCKTTGFWYSNSIRYNFLLLAHEFLPVFKKPPLSSPTADSRQLCWLPTIEATWQDVQVTEQVNREQLETTSVWIFPAQQMQAEIQRNLVERFVQAPEPILKVELGALETIPHDTLYPLVHIRCCADVKLAWAHYFDLLSKATEEAIRHLRPDGFCVIETRDFRQGDTLIPMGLWTFEHLQNTELALREIVIVTSEENLPLEPPLEGHLGITHKYLLIYRKS